MRDVFVTGTGIIPFGRYLGRTVREMSEAVVRQALADAALSASQVGYIAFGNAVAGLMTGQEMIRGQAALRGLGFTNAAIVNVENACGTSSTAFHTAWLAVASGLADTALVVGVEKLTHEDRGRALAAIGTGIDLADTVSDTGGAPFSFMELYASQTRDYMARSGATALDFAEVVVKSRRHAGLNPIAQFRYPTTLDEVLAARAVAGPLTVPMCSPVGDGAAALVLSAGDPAGGGVRVRAAALLSGSPGRSAGEPDVVERSVRAAYEQAGVGPEDLDLVELHDAAAPAELVDCELLGLCPPGDGPKLLRSGATALGGRIPVNPSGGLLSRGHPIGATGAAQLVELVDQLRGRCGARQVEGARIAAAQNGGGWVGNDGAAACVTVMSR